MTSHFFQRWLSHFIEQMRTETRHVLLLVDNVSSHRSDKPLSHVELRMVPPSITTFLQPQDAAIISSFKAQISKIQHRYIADRLTTCYGVFQTQDMIALKRRLTPASTWAFSLRCGGHGNSRFEGHARDHLALLAPHTYSRRGHLRAS